MRWALLFLISFAHAQTPDVPDRQIPPAVLANLATLQDDFARALAQDCAEERCFSKGCIYAGHKVVDRPATGSLPGLRLQRTENEDPKQLFLTTAECSFTHERSVSPRNARALARRLEAKVSKGWTKVQVNYERLLPVSDAIRDTPDDYYGDEDEDEEDDPEPIPSADAGVDAAPTTPETWEPQRELWSALLPHFSWMIALVLGAIVALLIIWGFRRLGRESPEEQLLLAQMLAETGVKTTEAESTDEDAAHQAMVNARLDRWRTRFANRDGADPALEALVADLLRTGERRVLAKAALCFPEALPNAFPREGSLASAKFQLAEYIKTVDPATLPTDEAFLDSLDRYALASSLTAHPDTDLIRSLHDEFGPAALVELVGRIPARFGALLFALAPDAMQHEATALMPRERFAEITDQLLRSNRMDPTENQYLLDVLAALRRSDSLPHPPAPSPVSDRGIEFAATAALSILLPRLDPEVRGALVGAAEGRGNGQLPSWLTGTVYGEMLLHLPPEQRNDLLLQTDAAALSAWLRAQTPRARLALLESAPTALQAAVFSAPPPENPGAFHALVNDARATLSGGLRRILMRGEMPLRALLA